MTRYGLRDDQWGRIKDLLPGKPGDVGVTAGDNPRFVEAALYRWCAGIPWRDLPERFGDWKNTHRRFSRWAKTGIWERLFQHLATDADNEYAMIDRPSCGLTSSPAPVPKKRAEDQTLNRGRGGLSTKIHALIDALGNPVRLLLTIADRAFDADARYRPTGTPLPL